jgi:hypothetical protein
MSNEKTGYACPCCGFLTRSEPLPGTFEVCPVCFWEDDNIQAANPEFEGGANRVSLKEARHNFAQFGAIEARYVQRVRAALPDEMPEENGNCSRARGSVV